MAHSKKELWFIKEGTLFWAIVLFAFFYWLTAAAIDAFFFRDSTLWQEIFNPSSHDWWTRLLVILLFAILAISSRNLLVRMEEINALLRREVRERQKAEQAYKQLLVKNELILNSAGEGIYGLDLEGHVTFFNEAAARITGYPQEELWGKNIHEILHHTKANGTPYPIRECPIFASLRNGEVNRMAQDVFWRREGGSFPVEYVSAPIYENQELTGLVVVFRDITARKKSEEESRKAKDYLENVLENSADAIGIVDKSGKIVKWNKAATTIFGYSFKELQGKSAFELYVDRQELNAMLALLRRDGFVRTHEIKMWRQDGSVGVFALSISLLYGQNREVMGSVCVARDRTDARKTMAQHIALNEQLQKEIADRKQAEADLQEAKTNLEGLVQEFAQRNLDLTLLNELGDLLQACLNCQEAYDAIAHLAPQLFPQESGGLYVLNPGKTLLERVAVWGREELQSEPVFPPDECWAFRRGEVHKIKRAQISLACQHLKADAPVDSLCIPVMAHADMLGLMILQSVPGHAASPDSLQDFLTEAKQRLALTLARQVGLAMANLNLRETLRSQAIRDPLTGLFNRRYMEETLEREIQRVKRRGKSLGVIMLDLDFLKPINDNLGHEAGDQVLRVLGKFLAANVRREDIACRYGGDEFTLILPEADRDNTYQRADELRQKISSLEVEYQGQSLGPITASLGVAIFPAHGRLGEEILRVADAALYSAKAEGRNQLKVAPSPDANAAPPDLGEAAAAE